MSAYRQRGRCRRSVGPRRDGKHVGIGISRNVDIAHHEAFCDSVGDGGNLIGVGLTRNELKEGARNLRYSCLSQTYRDTSCDAIHRQTDTQR